MKKIFLLIIMTLLVGCDSKYDEFDQSNWIDDGSCVRGIEYTHGGERMMVKPSGLPWTCHVENKNTPNQKVVFEYEIELNKIRQSTKGTQKDSQPIKTIVKPSTTSLSCGDNNLVYVSKTEYDSDNFGIANSTETTLLVTTNYPQGIGCDKQTKKFDKALLCQNDHWYLQESKYSTNQPNVSESTVIKLLKTENNPQGITCN